MRKFFQKNIISLLCTVLLAGAAFYGFLKTETAMPSFYMESEAGKVRINAYVHPDGSYYVFLPSYAEMEQVKISLNSYGKVTLDGRELSDGMSCGGYAPDTEYALKIGGGSPVTLTFLRSANVAAMYINTVSGDLDSIHADKNYEETASVAVFTEDGTLNHFDVAATIKGRGNATWKYEKKPYSLKLSGIGDLLDMGAATDWVLLSNATDQSNLYNKLVYDLAGQVGLEWAPECRYVDVYLNGEYHGLYLLTEKVEIGSERLDIDPEGGDFLCKLEFRSRWSMLRSPFLTGYGRTVEITGPKDQTEEELARVEKLVNGMEQSILRGTALTESIDLDSWARRYLIDEISGNIDSDLASSYFYYKDGLFYAGPVWDYDRSFGNTPRNENPRSFIAKNAYKAANYHSPYYGALYGSNAFYARVTKLYKEEFLPLLEALTDSGIEKLAGSIAASRRLNDLRWDFMFAHLQESDPSVEALITYLRERTEFLSSVWIDGVEYCTVQLELTPGGFYRNFAVEKGECLQIAELGLEIDTETARWLDGKTGEVFDLSQPVTEDMILTMQTADEESAPAQTPAADETEPPDTGETVTVLSLFVMAVLFVCMAATDIRRRIKERRNADAQSGTHISP